MSAGLFGIVISVHGLGATVRLDDGSLGAIPAPEVAANRSMLVRAMNRRDRLAFRRELPGRHAPLYLAESASPADETPRPFVPRLVDADFERRLGDYLKSTEEWAPADRPAPAERHFIRKKRRAVRFEARTDGT